MSWIAAQNQIDDCRLCEEVSVPYLQVPQGVKRHPPYSPPEPNQILFISVAPPWGGDYFWDETKPDRVREGLFEALLRATGKKFAAVSEFHSAGYFLVPGVKCPSRDGNKDHGPHGKAIANCTRHLGSEMQIVRPRRILALGLPAMKAVSRTCGLKIPSRVDEICRSLWWAKIGDCLVPVLGTYFPGNKRHQGFDRIPESINALLALQPKNLNKVCS